VSGHGWKQPFLTANSGGLQSICRKSSMSAAGCFPASPRVSTRAQSALDYSWMESVDPSGGVFITAEGLLVYLQPEQPPGLIAQCARRFPGGQMLFDLPPGRGRMFNAALSTTYRKRFLAPLRPCFTLLGFG
jgi:hypothetical protein